MMRRPIAALLVFVLLGPLPGSMAVPPPVNDSRVFTARPVAGIAPGHRFGALVLAEAWQLDSANPRFGGFSGLAWTAPRRFVMVSDAGIRVRFGLDRSGRTTALGWDSLPPLRPGEVRKRFLDAEAVTHDAASGRSWVTLEGIAEVWRFDAAGERSGRRHEPAMRRWPGNGGPESLARLPNGRFIIISERKISGDHHHGLLYSGDPVQARAAPLAFRYDSGAKGTVTDMAALPDGRMLILHRKLGLSPVFTSSIAIADPRRLKRAAVLTSRSIAVIRHRALAENYEGLTIEAPGGGAETGEAGRDQLSLWMVSDDNQNDWQATRLLRLHIDPAALK